MNYREAKAKFVESWGALGSSWGVSRTMAAIHALLLASESAISTEDVMNELNISRGNSNMNLRNLVNWGLAFKVMIPGERMEYFEAEKDVHKIATCIINQRKRQEIDTIQSVLNELKQVKTKTNEGKKFVKLISDMESYTNLLDKFTNAIIKHNKSWLIKAIKAFV